MDKNIYIVYLVENKINGKMYIGQHKMKLDDAGNLIDDGYRGSGTRIKRAHTKYGIDNFTFDELSRHTTKEECNKAEKWFADKDIVDDSNYYNLKEGGHGGFDHITEEHRKKQYQTCLERYGFKTPFQAPKVKEQIKQTCLDRYDVENPSQAEEIKERKKETSLKNFGVEYWTQSSELKTQKKQKYFELNGYYHYTQSSEWKLKLSTRFKTYLQNGVHPSQLKQICPHCNKEFDSANYGRWHGDKCKHKPA